MHKWGEPEPDVDDELVGWFADVITSTEATIHAQRVDDPGFNQEPIISDPIARLTGSAWRSAVARPR
jgi:hypothetical protein